MFVSLRARWARRLGSRTLLWCAFAVLHAAFLAAALPWILTGRAGADLGLYQMWASLGLESHYWPVLSYSWVYPFGALGPILLAGLAGPAFFELVWLLLITALNAVALDLIGRRARGTRSGLAAGWCWLLLVAITSPVDLLRLEGITAPLVVAGLLLVSRWPFAASAVLSAAMWVKVWPAAILTVLLAAGRRGLAVLAGVASVTCAIVAVAFSLGAVGNLASFVVDQSDRGLQIEAPVSTVWLWMADLGIGGAHARMNHRLAEFEVSGPGSATAAHLMNVSMAVAALVVLALVVRARARGAEPEQLLLVGSLAMVSALIVFNKVGSPQYMLWIAPVVVVGLARYDGRWRHAAALMAVIGSATTVVFPLLFRPIAEGDLWAAGVLTFRNALVVLMLGCSVAGLWNLASPSPSAARTRSGPARHQSEAGAVTMGTSTACQRLP